MNRDHVLLKSPALYTSNLRQTPTYPSTPLVILTRLTRRPDHIQEQSQSKTGSSTNELCPRSQIAPETSDDGVDRGIEFDDRSDGDRPTHIEMAS